MTRIAVVGMGLMGMLHARVFASLPTTELVAAIDVDPARREEARQVLGVPTPETLAEVLDHVDAVSVTLPDHLHVDTCVEALKNGKYVLVEKPLAATPADARTILEAQPLANQLMVGHLLRFDSRLQELRHRVTTGDLGTIRYVRVHRANTTGTAERFAGRVSVTSFLGVHDLDLVLWLTGLEIMEVRATGSAIFGESWDLSLANLQLTGGVQAFVEDHWLVHKSSARSCLAGVQVFGDRGMALVDLSTDELEVAAEKLGRSQRIDSHNWTHDAEVSGGSLRRELETFVRCIQEELPMPVPGEEAFRAVDAVERVERAMASGGRT